MPIKIRFAGVSRDAQGAVALVAAEGKGLSPAGRAYDEASGGQLTRAMDGAAFTGKTESTLEILAPQGLKASRIVIAGAGKASELDEFALEKLGGGIAGKLLSGKEKSAVLVFDALEGLGLDAALAAARAATGALLRSYRFDKYRTREKDKEEKPLLASLTVQCANPGSARKAFAAMEAVAEGVFLARDLVNEPANVLNPLEFARRARALARRGLKVEVLDERDMKRQKMHALLAVGQGSASGSRLLVLQWNGGKSGAKPLAIVGKGVTFDTGGISLKPSSGMEDMKGDMGGAACVAGLMVALAARRAKVNVVGIIGLVENMPDGTAQRPGDIVTSMSGQTIEVLNTDAEGRLVLADALWFAQKRFKPRLVIDLATLTGAILVALGQEHAGLFSDDDDLADKLLAAGKASGELVWRLPLAKAYDKMIDSDNADMKNIGGRNAGSITAAQFLKRFVKDTPWVHLDVAGTAMKSPKSPINQSWGSGYGVRLLDRLIADNYED